jgi:ribonuclease Z
MKIVLLGTTGYHPNEARQTACMLLPESGTMLDAGTALYRSPRYLRTPHLDIFLTHAHLDHVVGLSFLFDVLFQHPMDRVTVHGEPDKLAAVAEHLFAEKLFPAQPPCEFRPLKGEYETLPGGGRLTWFPVEHPGGTVGYRLDWPGHSMAYVTDTTAHANVSYIEHIRGVDLLVHECYFSDNQAEWAVKTGHSYTTPVAEVAHQAGVGRLVLVHINPLATGSDPVQIDAARAVFPATLVGEDLMELEF